MKAYFKLEFKKALFSRRTLISIFIIISLLVIPYLQDVVSFNPQLKKSINPYPGLDGVDYYIRISHFSYIVFIGPIIAGLIYSTSIIKDKESGFINKLLEIIDIKTYYKVKLAVNALITSIAFAVGHGILILYLIITLGVNNTPVKEIGSGAFTSIYEVSKISYIALMVLILALSSATFSTFILGVTTAADKKLIAYILPAFYVVATGVFFEVWSLNTVIDFNVTELFNLIINYTTNWLSVLIYDLVLGLVGVMLLYKFGYKRTLEYMKKSVIA